MSSSTHRYRPLIVWTLRIIVGATFVFSGFAKTVDPWGFIYKMYEYLSAWGIDWAPRGIVFMAAMFISAYEFSAGLMLLIGAFRRISVYALMCLMAVMLPLSAYIWIASPVADCGCFGDAVVISNGAAFAKNIVIVAALVVLIPRNMLVRGIVAPLYQWLPLSAAIIYCVVIGIIGYQVQPIVDFRPYKEGRSLLNDTDDADAELTLVYEKDGEEREFTTDALPDSTWTFVRRSEELAFDERQLAIYSDLDDVTEDVILTEGKQVLLIVNDPEYLGRARSSLFNRLNDFMVSHGGDMVGLAPISGDNLESWRETVLPDFDVFTVESTVLKEAARGDAALVGLSDGVVMWKRSIYSVPADFPDGIESLDELYDACSTDNEGFLSKLTVLLVLAIAVAAAMNPLLNFAKRIIKRK